MKKHNKNQMRVYTILILLVGAMTSVRAQEIILKANGGLSGVDYTSTKGSGNVKVGGGIGIGYTYYFSERMGIGTGIDVNVYRSDFKLNNLTISSFEVDDQASAFEYRVTPLNYQEEQRFYGASIPLMLQYRSKTAATTGIYFGVGGKVIFPMKQKVNVTAESMQLSGFYPDLNLTIDDLPNHGFGSLSDYDAEASNDLKTSFALSAEAGIYFKLKPNLNLYTGVYADYGITDIQKTNTADRNIVTYSPTGLAEIESNGVMGSGNTIDKSRLFAAGIQLKLGFALKKQHKAPKETIVEVDREVVEPEKPEIVPEKEVIVEVVEEKQPVLNEQELKILTEPMSFGKIDNVAITDELAKRLDKITIILNQHKELNVDIEGYTCDLGNKELNLLVGKRRAEAVADYLQNKGITPSRMQVISKGETDPLVPNVSAKNREKNRRVVLVVKE